MTLSHAAATPVRRGMTMLLFPARYDSIVVATMPSIVITIVMVRGVVDAATTQQVGDVQVLHGLECHVQRGNLGV